MGDLVRMPWLDGRLYLRARCLANIPLRGQTAKVLYLPPPRGRLAWWVRRGSVAHLAVWLPDPTRPGRWRWHLLCRHSRRHTGYWWAARDGERRCRTCEALLERARHRTAASFPPGRAA